MSGSTPCKSLNKLNSYTFTAILARETHYFIIALQLTVFRVIKRLVNCILVNYEVVKHMGLLGESVIFFFNPSKLYSCL